MMPQITTNLRTLFPNRLSFLSSLNPNPISKFNTRIIIPFNHNHPLFTCSSSVNPRRHNSRSFTSNRKPMKTDDDNKKVGLGGGFNKKRAEGKDKSSRPKDLKLKVRRLNPVNTISYLQILGTGMDTQDTSPSVLLFFDKQRFIFNAGEGLQRFCTEHKIKLSKIDHIFLSRVCSETAGGLPGLLLTLAGTGEEGMSVNVWGPSDFKYLVDAMKSFIPNAAMVHTRCFGPSSKFDGVLLNNNPEKVNDQIKLVDDEVVKISAVLLRPETGVVKDESATKSSDISVLYICELPEIRGKFDPEKARALGLRPGPKYRELQEGISVKSDLKDIMSYNSNLCKTVSAENLLKFHLRPYAQLGLDKSGIPIKAGPNEIINDLISELPEISDAAKQVSELWECEDDAGDGVTVVEGDKNINEEPWINQNIVSRCLENITREDVEIVLLGTGSSQPSKYRNVSSIFINLFSKGSLLLDCGEGTLGQLKRRFGIQGADNAVKGLKCIWISHIHADHHTGLARILTLRRDLLKGLPHEPLIVIGPRQLKRFLDAYERLEDLDMQFLDCRHTTQDSLALFESNYDNQLNENKIENTLFSKGSQMQSHWKKGITSVDSSVSYPIIKNLKNVIGVAGLENVISFPVVHCPQAFGVVLKGMDRVDKSGEIIPGWKIVYSGDTRPCPELVEASRGATVLIHEATFEDALVEEAIARNHSTTAEAIEMGNSAGAYRIVLTHFSQRYPKIPVFDESYMHKTCIAFDMMSINFADLHVLPRVLPYLKLLFKNEMIVDESDDVEDAVTIAA
ncbi:tRNAse Z TRZ4, mitochondrial-like isoform X2 [Bidens hawaiensis]|uniref:tRNAse Z TRZ4, mitochondrial-like isoform X2 n=1 Tax=Bidens hawaiensis TaxID=980011 RepID=UPI00404A12DD